MWRLERLMNSYLILGHFAELCDIPSLMQDSCKFILWICLYLELPISGMPFFFITEMLYIVITYISDRIEKRNGAFLISYMMALESDTGVCWLISKQATFCIVPIYIYRTADSQLEEPIYSCFPIFQAATYSISVIWKAVVYTYITQKALFKMFWFLKYSDLYSLTHILSCRINYTFCFIENLVLLNF